MSRDYRDYIDPTVGQDDDDGTMPTSVAALADAVVGHRIVRVDSDNSAHKTRLHLDDGRTVTLVGESDCCAYTDVEKIIPHLPGIDHLITAVATTDGYARWHILADAGSVLELEVNWSCGNPFYYAYGLTVTVEPTDLAEAGTR
jgi:hypothetical protein